MAKKTDLSQIWIAQGKVMEFDGFLKVYNDNKEDIILPEIKLEEQVSSNELSAKQNMTKPPARYTESTLVKALESRGIGRPSTYASTISTIQDRWYVDKIEWKLKPTEIAFGVNDFLEKYFEQLMNYEFTAKMEDELDDIANGDLDRKKSLEDFYKGFSKELEISKWSERVQLGTGKTCPKCNEWELIVRFGKDKRSRFLWCSRYPECDYITSTQDTEDKLAGLKEKYEWLPCPAGWTIVVKIGRFGPFLTSSDYPTVKWIKSPKQYELDIKIGDNKPDCPKCWSEMTIRSSRRGSFWGCSKYPECDGIKNLDMKSVS